MLVCPGTQLLSQSSSTDSTFLANKTIQAIRISGPPKIDGLFDEPFWKTLPVADDFVEYAPRNGEKPPYPTEVRFAYDDQALYIGAIMFDPHADSICKELGKRDQIESLNTDYISFDILPYNDDLNMYEFKVSPSGLQGDCKYTAIGQDFSWDAVWENAHTITDTTWTAEVRIPWSALRFPSTEKQVWGINMWRNFHRRQEFSTWTFVSNQTNDIFKYYGELVGMENINPPLRLSFSPYLAGYMEKDPGNKDWSYFTRGGLDLKYGINESYTLDMMMIPDFGQVQSDDQVLNLTPFEIRYDEKRQFFTEATELFDKCGIFYSRRIGSTPKNFFAPYSLMEPSEKINNNPEETRIINATKISGRNGKGLGIGFFNAMTTNTYAEVGDTMTFATRRIMTQPFTNYNVTVFDQNLPNNSYATLINTNYFTPADEYLANVTGAETRLNNKKNNFAFFGRLNVSSKNKVNAGKGLGHNYLFSFSKPSGKFRYTVMREEINKYYDPNDMGFLLNNNEAENTVIFSHHIFRPVWKIRQAETEFEVSHSTLSQPQSFTSLRFQASNTVTFNNLWISYFETGYMPKGFHDYYEPRVWGRVYKIPAFYDLTWLVATDTRKTLRIHNTLGIVHCPANKNFYYIIETIPRVRLSDRFNISLTIRYEHNLNDHGWVRTAEDINMDPLIYFGQRTINTVNNILNVKYIFNIRSSLSLRVRHYWSSAAYNKFYTLDTDGRLDESDYTGSHDINLNVFNVDLQYVWYFAPGSELSLVWKNAVNRIDENTINNYWRNFDRTIHEPQMNSISFRLLYYLDYLALKKSLTGRKA